MTETLLIDAVHPEEVRVALVNDSRLEEFDFETASKKPIKGNIYLGKVTRVEPSLQAAFVEYGGNKQGFLPFSEIHFDYYQVPVADKEKIAAALEETESPEDVESTEEKIEDEKDAAGNPEGEEAEEDKTEEIASEDEIYESVKQRRARIYKQYKIQEVLKRNQIILVQVIKEERGNKGASLTTYISLAGRYCVLMPNTDRAGGVSRRISDMETRKKLKSIVSDFELSKGASLIIRTAGASRDKKELDNDYSYLNSLWESIKKRTLDSEAPALIHEEGDLIKRSLRDMYRQNIDQILIEGKDALNNAKDFLKTIDPNAKRGIIKEYKEAEPLFQHYKIEDQLDELYENTASLKSGGSLVIHQTEALVSIDVNSGRATRERSIEDTALKTNLEAAEEVARQLRLRDLAGLVVIDFIDMRELKNKRSVERALKDALKSDRAKIQVGRISMFGLMEMSRQRMRSSISETSATPCPRCNGMGVIRSEESTALKLLRAIESRASKSEIDEVRMRTSSEAAFYLLNEKREEIIKIEENFGVKVFIDHDHNIIGADFAIDKPRGWRKKERVSKRKPSPKSSSDEKGKPTKDDASKKHEEVDDDIGNKIDNTANAKNSRGGKKPPTKKSSSNRPAKNKRAKEHGAEITTLNVENTAPENNNNKGSGEDSSKIKGLWKKITQ